jgi:biopolymer transport protein ExbB
VKSPVGRLVAAAVGEADRSEGLATEGIKDRAATLLARLEAQRARAIAREMGILATIGAVAPFVGPFGTVWGIMDSFIGTSKTNTTNLAVVAPGIAEALLATAMGLIAAIPAVVMYNGFARAIANYRAQLGDAAAEVVRHLSRDLDREGIRQKEDTPIDPIRRGNSDGYSGFLSKRIVCRRRGRTTLTANIDADLVFNPLSPSMT